MSRTPYFVLLAWLLACAVAPAFAFKMESGSINIAATTGGSPAFTRRTFQQTYSTPPVVVVMTWPTGGDDSTIVRVRNVTTTSFEATVVESPGEDGPHAAMTVHYFAIDPGIHTLTVADAVRGTRTITIEAGHLHTTQNLRCTALPAACTGGFATHSFASAFATTPVVMVDLQTFNVGASGVPPAPPVPFITASIDNVTSSGFAYTIDRHEVTAGSLTPTEADSEVIGYVALDSDLTNADFNANNAAALLVEMETIRIAATAANAADGWDDRCNEDIRFSKPMGGRQAFATKQTRRETDGGWLRLCSRLSAALLRVNVVEDRFGDAERSKSLRDGVGVLLFSDAFFFDSDFRPPTAGFKLEADRFTLTPGTPVTVTLRQYYAQPPAVFVILDNSNPELTAVRVLDVASDANAGTTSFTALAIEPQGAAARGRASTPGGSAGTAHYLAIDKGVHVLPGGKLLEVDEVLISDVQQNFPGTRSFRTVNFSTRFAVEPAVLTQLTGDANLPGDAQVPWLTLAVRTSAALRTSGFQVALERSQVDAGGAITQPERVAYMAVETGTLPVFTDNAGVAVRAEFQNANLNGSANAGWDNICFNDGVLGIPFLGTYASPPLVIASEHSHANNDGGWQRWCRITNTHARIVEDEDQFADIERSHQAENSSLAVFSQPFDADFALIALYAMEEPVWNSGTLGQVANTTTLFANGTPIDNAATAIATPARTSGLRGTCRYGSFDGRADLGTLPDGVAIGTDNLALSRALTVSAWIRWQIDPTTGNNSAAYIQNDRVGSYSDFQFAMRGSANNRRFEFHAATSGGRRSVRSGNIVNANVWYHVTGVYDGSSLRLYVDDSLVDSTPLSGAFVAFDAARELNLAFSAHPGNNHHAFNGLLDEVRIYRRALTVDEIRDLRLFTRPCNPDPLDHYALDHAGGTGGFAVTCEAAAVTLRAHDITHAAIAPSAGTSVTITANPGTQWALSSGTPANFSSAGASATYAFNGVENAVGLLLTQTTPAVVSFSVSDSGGRSAAPSESPTLEFRDAIFDFQPAIATQIAGKPSDVAPNAQALTLRAIETNSATGACQAALDGTHAVEFAFECRSPATCALAAPGAVEGLAGAMRSAAALAHSLWLADGSSPASVTMDGNAVAIVNGYPDIDSIIEALQGDPLTEGYDATGVDGQYTADSVTAANYGTCNVTYTEAASLTNPPTIVVTTSNCD